MFRPLPIGVENFEKIYTEEYYYIDKTLFIKELLDKKADVNLFTRPRRFGKTLTLSMLQYYFEDAYDLRGNKRDYSYLFDDKNIMNAGERYTRHMGQYPVISLTLKSGKQADFDDCMHQLIYMIAKEFSRHRYILKDDILSQTAKEQYVAYMDRKATQKDYKMSLNFLSECLEEWSGKKVIILLDEYDVPLEGTYVYGFYDQMVDFIREFFGATLKTNSSLYFAVITGCLRISKESIFTGLNNIYINSVLNNQYGEYFGFTEEEVEKMCHNFSLDDKYAEIKDWYNGYVFGKKNVYNPWSCIHYIFDHADGDELYPKPYWVNTSSNSIVKDLVYRASAEARTQIGNLIDGGTIEVPVHEDITYDEVYQSDDNLWNFMFFTGYFKKVGERFQENQDKTYASLQIVNREVRYIFQEKVRNWFRETIEHTDRNVLFHALLEQDTALLQREINTLLMGTISYHDALESFYHGFLAGILTGMKGYLVKSNREGGTGRSDLFIKPLDRTKTAFVIEIKVAKSIADLSNATKTALDQIEDRNYERELVDDGYIKAARYGMAFFKKNCQVTTEKEHPIA